MRVLMKAFMEISLYAPLMFHADAIYTGSKLCEQHRKAAYKSVKWINIKEKKSFV